MWRGAVEMVSAMNHISSVSVSGGVYGFSAWLQCAIALLKTCECLHEQSTNHIFLNIDVSQTSKCALASAEKQSLTERGLL